MKVIFDKAALTRQQKNDSDRNSTKTTLVTAKVLALTLVACTVNMLRS